MSRFTRFFSGKFQNMGNCAGVKHLTNIMSGYVGRLSFTKILHCKHRLGANLFSAVYSKQTIEMMQNGCLIILNLNRRSRVTGKILNL